MPKLSKKMAKAAANAEISSGDFPLLDPGFYYAQLMSVDVRDGNYAPQWTAEFHNLFSERTGEKASGRQWYRMHIVPEGDMPANYPNGPKKWANWQKMSLGVVHGFFDAFGYSTDSDTDELVGEWVKIKVKIRTIQQGDRKGEKVNDVGGVAAVPDDFDPSEFLTGDDDEESAF
jgi:hypothetical protein